jgi:hypothetical protein
MRVSSSSPAGEAAWLAKQRLKTATQAAQNFVIKSAANQATRRCIGRMKREIKSA